MLYGKQGLALSQGPRSPGKASSLWELTFPVDSLPGGVRASDCVETEASLSISTASNLPGFGAVAFSGHGRGGFAPRGWPTQYANQSWPITHDAQSGTASQSTRKAGTYYSAPPVDTGRLVFTYLSMRTRRTMNVSITPELEQLVADTVASGRYGSASEVVRAALRLFEERERRTARNRETAAGSRDAR